MICWPTMSDSADRIPSDHDTVESYRVHLEEVGRTGRLQLPLPAELSCVADDTISVCFDGSAYHAQVSSTLEGAPAIRGAYTDRALARTREGEDKLAPWLEDSGLSPGDPVLLDVLTPGYAYGLRLPGERVGYDPPGRPDASLTAVAQSLDEG